MQSSTPTKKSLLEPIPDTFGSSPGKKKKNAQSMHSAQTLLVRRAFALRGDEGDLSGRGYVGLGFFAGLGTKFLASSVRIGGAVGER